MRYLGNKDSITDTIKEIILDKVSVQPNTVFFDAFCGTGAVSNAFKDKCKIVISDNLHCATTYALGRMVAETCSFQKLGLNPFEFFHSNNEMIEGFFFQDRKSVV